MSLETELKKIGNNLQQLTDAVVTLTAELQTLKGTPVAQVSPVVETVVATEQPTDTPPIQQQETNVVAIDTTPPFSADTVAGMTIADANLELQSIVAQIGDGGVAVRNLLKEHNAISLAQIAPENYVAFVKEARGLIQVGQA